MAIWGIVPQPESERTTMKKNKLVTITAAIFVAMVSSPLYAAVPPDGGEWAIGAGETETLAAEATVLRLAVNGSLTLDAGAALTATGGVVNCISTGDGRIADMTIANGASLVVRALASGKSLQI